MMKRLSLLLVLAVLLPTSALAQSKSISPEIRKLRNEIAALKLDHTLALTRDQARALLPLLKEAGQVRDQLRAEQEKRKDEIVKALTAVRDDLVKTGAVSEASRLALQQARGEQTMDGVRAKARAVWDKTRVLLTAEQKARLRSYDYHPLDGGNEFDGADGEKPEVRGPRGGRGAGQALKPQKMLRIAASPEFIALVEARAK